MAEVKVQPDALKIIDSHFEVAADAKAEAVPVVAPHFEVAADAKAAVVPVVAPQALGAIEAAAVAEPAEPAAVAKSSETWWQEVVAETARADSKRIDMFTSVQRKWSTQFANRTHAIMLPERLRSEMDIWYKRLLDKNWIYCLRCSRAQELYGALAFPPDDQYKSRRFLLFPRPDFCIPSDKKDNDGKDLTIPSEFQHVCVKMYQLLDALPQAEFDRCAVKEIPGAPGIPYDNNPRFSHFEVARYVAGAASASCRCQNSLEVQQLQAALARRECNPKTLELTIQMLYTLPRGHRYIGPAQALLRHVVAREFKNALERRDMDVALATNLTPEQVHLLTKSIWINKLMPQLHAIHFPEKQVRDEKDDKSDEKRKSQQLADLTKEWTELTKAGVQNMQTTPPSEALRRRARALGLDVTKIKRQIASIDHLDQAGYPFVWRARPPLLPIGKAAGLAAKPHEELDVLTSELEDKKELIGLSKLIPVLKAISPDAKIHVKLDNTIIPLGFFSTNQKNPARPVNWTVSKSRQQLGLEKEQEHQEDGEWELVCVPGGPSIEQKDAKYQKADDKKVKRCGCGKVLLAKARPMANVTQERLEHSVFRWGNQFNVSYSKDTSGWEQVRIGAKKGVGTQWLSVCAIAPHPNEYIPPPKIHPDNKGGDAVAPVYDSHGQWLLLLEDGQIDHTFKNLDLWSNHLHVDMIPLRKLIEEWSQKSPTAQLEPGTAAALGVDAGIGDHAPALSVAFRLLLRVPNLPPRLFYVKTM